MLFARALSALNPARLRLRRPGYVRQSRLPHARSRRCRLAWAPHLERARTVVATKSLSQSPIATHLAALDAVSRTAERVCMIADTVQRQEDRHGGIVGSRDLRSGIALPVRDAAWDREIAPFGEIGRRRRLIHRVHGYRGCRAVRA